MFPLSDFTPHLAVSASEETVSETGVSRCRQLTETVKPRFCNARARWKNGSVRLFFGTDSWTSKDCKSQAQKARFVKIFQGMEFCWQSIGSIQRLSREAQRCFPSLGSVKKLTEGDAYYKEDRKAVYRTPLKAKEPIRKGLYRWFFYEGRNLRMGLAFVSAVGLHSNLRQ